MGDAAPANAMGGVERLPCRGEPLPLCAGSISRGLPPLAGFGLPVGPGPSDTLDVLRRLMNDGGDCLAASVHYRYRAAVIGSDVERLWAPGSVTVRRGPRITSHSPSSSSPMKVKLAVSVQGPGESTVPKVSTA